MKTDEAVRTLEAFLRRYDILVGGGKGLVAGLEGVVAIRAVLAEVDRLKQSMVDHFQRDHIEGDGPEIDRWKLRAEKAEADLAQAHKLMEEIDRLTLPEEWDYMEKALIKAKAELAQQREFKRRANRKIGAALALHVKNKHGYCEWCSRLATRATDYVMWPCETVKALRGDSPEPEEDFSWFRGEVNHELLEKFVKDYPKKKDD